MIKISRIFTASLLYGSTAVASAHAESMISIPVSASLSDIAAIAEKVLPTVLVRETTAQTCVKAERLCTKIPEFRGFKIYSRMECINVTPSIDCSIDQEVRRVGQIRVHGSGGTLSLSQRFDGRVTVRGRGEIGRHIRQTATGTAEIDVNITPRITEDWRVVARLSHQIDWPRAPTTRLFNVFPVTFQTRATDEINGAIEAFKANEMRQYLDGIDLEARISPLWRELQKPVSLKLADDSTAFLYFRPKSVALAPFNFDNNSASTRIAISGQFQLTDKKQDWKPINLPRLSAETPPRAISLTVPIHLGMDTLSKLVKTPVHIEFDKPVSGTMEIRSLNFREEKDGVLVVRLESSITAAGLGTVDASFSVRGIPKWSSAARILSLQSPMVDFEGGHAAFFLNKLAASAFARRRIAEFLRVPLGQPLDQMRNELSAALTRNLAEGVSMRGNVDLLVIDDFHLKDGLLLMTAKARGNADVTALELN